MVFHAFATVTNFDEGMQKAQNDHDGRKQGSPSCLRGTPAIGIDCLGNIVEIHIVSFSFEMSIRLKFSSPALGLTEAPSTQSAPTVVAM